MRKIELTIKLLNNKDIDLEDLEEYLEKKYPNLMIELIRMEAKNE